MVSKIRPIWANNADNILSFGATVTRSLSRFLLIWVASFLLVKDQFGLLNVFLVIYFFARISSDGFVHMPYIKFFAEVDRDRRALNTHALGLKILLVAAVSSVFLLSEPYWIASFSLSSFSISTLLPTLLLSFSLFSFLTQFLNANGQYGRLFSLELVQLVALIVSGCVLYFFFNDLALSYDTMLICMVAAFIVAALFGWICYGRNIHFSTSYDSKLLKELISYGRYSVITAVGAMLYIKSDILMIAQFLTPEDVAIYGLAALIIELVNVTLDSFQKVVLPASSSLVGTNDEKKKLKGLFLSFVFKAQLATIFVTSLVILFAFFGLEWVYGDTYADSKLPLIILALSSMLKPAGYIAGTMLSGIGAARLDNRNCWWTAGMNIGLNIVFIPILGVLGAALTTLACNLAFSVFQVRSLKGQVGF